MSQVIITAFSGRVTSSPDGNEAQSNSDSTTLNAHTLHTCEAGIDGVDCQAQATQQYTISTTGVTRHLCDVHFRMLLRMVRLWHWRRVMTYVDEQEQEARGVA